jgi:enoyl-[acyl-carrier-protein] reductase (NADH)
MHKTITLSDAVEKIPDGASGGALFAMSFYGAEKVIEHYNLMAQNRSLAKPSTWMRDTTSSGD